MTKIKLQEAKLPKLLGDLLHSNQFLKMFSLYALTLVMVTLVGILILATKDPKVITLSSEGKVLLPTVLPRAEDEITEAVRAYLEKRYKWGPADIVKKLKASESFIMPNTLKAFQEAVSKITKFSTEKAVSQVIYPAVVKVNLAKKTVNITGDRITSIQGMKAAGDLNLEISFESGSRTKENPWGIYITKEKEE
ncbi:MAG TPA: hypothetical protein VNJ01_09180 [Bacteriovoracaceae bacterium]|nr:hypothetical protein [Bacteriovoracaceae bacterium]